MQNSTPSIFTVKKFFFWDGSAQQVGSVIEIYVGSNMEETQYRELLEAGVIVPGKDDEFIKEVSEKEISDNLKNDQSEASD